MARAAVKLPGRWPGEWPYGGIVEVRLFGELEAADRGVALAVRGVKQRALLALLALQRGEPVSADRLIDVLWGDGQAANPASALQAQIGQLRRTLGAAAIVTGEAGYTLAVGPDDVDVVRFERLVAKGRRLSEEGDAALASAVLGDALSLRRGEPLAEFADAGFADIERAHLDKLTVAAIETRAEADLMLTAAGHLRERLSSLPVPAALLETKFYVPRSRRGLVPRPRLRERLDRGTASKLTLVSAPAGFGKTTLLTEWLAAGPAAPAGERLAAWLSLDRGDNDPASFWAYVIAAQRPGRHHRRHRAGIRRLPRHRRARCAGRDGVPARSSAAGAACGDRQSR